MMKYAIVTGISRGLGEALAQELLEKGWQVLGLSRNNSSKLDHPNYQFHALDLQNTREIHSIVEPLFQKVQKSAPATICLINNAATAAPVGKTGELSAEDSMIGFSVNLIGPYLLASLFCKWFAALEIERKILNISSGAAQSPISGCGPYCMAKAGLEMLTRIIATEHSMPNFYCAAIRPGIIDTEMQHYLRSQAEESVPSVEMFKKFKSDGLLKTSAEVSQKIVQNFVLGALENGRIYLAPD